MNKQINEYNKPPSKQEEIAQLTKAHELAKKLEQLTKNSLEKWKTRKS